MFIRNNRKINILVPYVDENGTEYPHLQDAREREKLGIIEISDPMPPEDYSEEIYYRTEIDVEPYVIYTKKSDEQIKLSHNEKILNQIRVIEENSLLPRVTRDLLMANANINSFAFAKLKDIDDQINTLRSQLIP